MAASADVDKHIRGVAVFDFDGTLIDGQSGTLFTRYLRSNGMMSPGSFVRLAWWGIRYKLHFPFKQEEARELMNRMGLAEPLGFAEAVVMGRQRRCGKAG